MHKSVRALLLSTLAATGLVVVSAPAAHADSYTQVAFASKGGRQAVLWRNNANGCLHAQGKSLRDWDKVSLLLSNGDSVSVTAKGNGVSVNTPSRCTKHGTDYWAYVSWASTEGPKAGPYRNF